ncbi:hypothetical protein M2156_001215 [Streptomyces sp. SAI-149]|nr:hypothetical protein [Streptomyces sp. SAI-119]MDH6494996.1 hypothetical protein [Streptomyces sp. SAI-149]
MAVPRNTLKKWEKVREFTLALPGAAEAHAHALTAPGAEPAGYGLGKAGWVRVPLAERGAPAAELLCDWVEESLSRDRAETAGGGAR